MIRVEDFIDVPTILRSRYIIRTTQDNIENPIGFFRRRYCAFLHIPIVAWNGTVKLAANLMCFVTPVVERDLLFHDFVETNRPF